MLPAVLRERYRLLPPEQLGSCSGVDLRVSFLISEEADALAMAASLNVCTLAILGAGDPPPTASLLFHSLADAATWILEHPEGDTYLHDQVRQGAQLLRAGKLVAFPTETVYGLGADALTASAVARIFAAKGRPAHDPLIVHIAAPEQVTPLVSRLPAAAETLIDRFWPGPLTLVLPKSPNVPDIVTAGHSTVALRMTAHPLALELLREAGLPVAAPSANLFGRTSPTTAAHVADQLGDQCDLVIDGGACRVGVESTVLSLAGAQPVMLRHGGITEEEISACIGPLQSKPEPAPDDLQSPGMLPGHYAPQTTLKLVDDVAEYADQVDVGVMTWRATTQTFCGSLERLSEQGDLREVAANLYAAMRRLDSRGLRLIVAERVPDSGLGRAINDRLQRAAWREE